MKPEEIESLKYWLHEFANGNCGYKEFSEVMAEDVPKLLGYVELLEKEVQKNNDNAYKQISRLSECVEYDFGGNPVERMYKS